MTLAAIDPVNAPRDLQELVRKGRFQIRKLADDLKIIEDPEKRAAFLGRNTEQQAQEVLAALLAHDKGANGVANGAAAAAPADTGSKLKRTPVNKGTVQTNEAPVSTASTGSAAPFSIAPLMEALKETSGKLDAVLSNQAVILERLENLTGLSGLATATSLLVGETTLNASRADILAAAMEDVTMVIKECGEALGKAKK